MSHIAPFGPFEADLDSGQLRKGGIRIKLRDQSFQVLTALLDRPGEVVTREALRQRLWGSDVIVDFDFARGLVSLDAGRLADAVDAFRRSVELSGGLPPMLGGLGLALAKSGDVPGARALLEGIEPQADRLTSAIHRLRAAQWPTADQLAIVS